MKAQSDQDVVEMVQKKYNVQLEKVPRRKIIYNGKLKTGERLILCTPYSRIHSGGFGWVDFTVSQVSMLTNAEISIVAFRLEDGNTYFVNFRYLRPLFTDDAMKYNENQGDHWKMHIGPDYLIILGNEKRIHLMKDSLRFL